MPIIFFVILLSIVAIVQKLYPNLLLANTCFALITTLMYYTIENPDIKMAKELAFSKKIAEESRDRTLNVLNEISDELKNSFSKLQTFGYKKVNYQDLEEVSKELKYIKKYNLQEKIHLYVQNMLKLFINNIFSNQPDKQPETLIKQYL